VACRFSQSARRRGLVNPQQVSNIMEKTPWQTRCEKLLKRAAEQFGTDSPEYKNAADNYLSHKEPPAAAPEKKASAKRRKAKKRRPAPAACKA
jgi:hypothetical protein